MQVDAFAAELLEQGARGYAAAAAAHLTGAAATRSEPYVGWQQYFVQRLLELAAAVGSGEPRLFVDRTLWAQRTLAARGVAIDHTARGLAALREVLSESLPERARDAALTCLDAALEAVAAPPAPETAGLDPAKGTDRLALAYLQSALEGDATGAIDRIVAATRSGLAFESALLDVLLPAQREIGRLWHLDQVTVGEEHLVTATTERAMAVLASQAPRRADRQRTAVAAAVAGNPHEVGIRAIAYLLEFEGWRTIHLGNDLPADELPSLVTYFAADLVLLSCTLSIHLRALRDTIERLRAPPGPGIKIMVGGYVFKDAPDLWRELGADGYAPDARAAVALAPQLADSADSG